MWRTKKAGSSKPNVGQRSQNCAFYGIWELRLLTYRNLRRDLYNGSRICAHGWGRIVRFWSPTSKIERTSAKIRHWMLISNSPFGEPFSRHPMFLNASGFLYRKAKIEIYTDACERPREKWRYQFWIGSRDRRNLGNWWSILWVFSLEINENGYAGYIIFIRRSVFFELLGTYIGVRLWSPYVGNNNDFGWIGPPPATGNKGNDCILRKHYAASLGPNLGFCKNWLSIIWQTTSR